MSIGVRYEVDTHPLNNDLDKPIIAEPLLPLGTAPTPINKKNFAPHAGIAWDPFKDGKTSIRAGFGLYYAMRISNLVTNERAQLAPFNSGNATIGLTAGTAGSYDFNKDGKYVYDFSPAFSPTATSTTAMPIIAEGQQVFISAPQSSRTLLDTLRSGVIITNDLVTPYSQQANVGVQRELLFSVVIDADFVYSRSVHEFTRDIDQANLFPGNGTPMLPERIPTGRVGIHPILPVGTPRDIPGRLPFAPTRRARLSGRSDYGRGWELKLVFDCRAGPSRGLETNTLSPRPHRKEISAVDERRFPSRKIHTDCDGTALSRNG